MVGTQTFAVTTGVISTGLIALADLPITPEAFKGLGPTAILGFIACLSILLGFYSISRTARALEKIAEKLGESNIQHNETNKRLDEVAQKLGQFQL